MLQSILKQIIKRFSLTAAIIILTGAFLCPCGTIAKSQAPKKDNHQTSPAPLQKNSHDRPKRTVAELMAAVKTRIANSKLKWPPGIFVEKGWETGGYSNEGMPLIYWKRGNPEQQTNVSLVLSAVHGDEVTAVFFGFRLVQWLEAHPELCKDKFIVVAPFVNPDGFFFYLCPDS